MAINLSVPKMVSMECDDENDQITLPSPVGDKPTGPRYPYGLCITLTHEQLARLDLDPEDATVGGTVHLFALARITSASINQNLGGDLNTRIELQIESLAVESEDAENRAEDAAEDRAPPRQLSLRGLYKRG